MPQKIYDDEYCEMVDILERAEKRAQKKGVNPNDTIEEAKKEIEIEKILSDQVCPNPDASIDPFQRKLGEEKTLFRAKPVPYAVSMKKITSIYETWGSTGVASNCPIKPLFKPLFAMQYLTGTRISECLRLRRQDVDFNSTIDKQGRPRDFMEVYAVNLKQGKATPKNSKAFKQIATPCWGLEEKMAKDLERHCEKFSAEEPLFQVTEKFTEFFKQDKMDPCARVMAWQQFRKIDYGPLRLLAPDNSIIYKDSWTGTTHYLRRCRLTHYVTYYKFNETMLKAAAGWTTNLMVGTYVNIGAEEMKEQFLDRIVE
jgi:integrase